MSDQPTRPELLRLEVPAGVAVLAVQVQELSKDVAHLEHAINEHRKEHREAEREHARKDQAAERDRARGRRWIIGTIIAVLAAIDGPVVTVLLSHWHA